MATTPGRIVSVEWLAQHADRPNVVVVDVRPADQYNAGHIPGARAIDFYPLKILDSDPTVIGRWVSTMQSAFRALGVRNDDHVVFYEDISGASAAHGVWLMEALSIGHGAMLDGGLSAWPAAGHELSTEPVSVVTPSDVTVALNHDVFATASEILQDLDAGNGAVIIDTRNQLEWMRGTIPSSTHLEWTAHLNADGTLKPKNRLRELYEDIGVRTGDEVITFCASGYRAAHTWLVLSELGYENVRNYAPSWGEWGRRGDVPIEVPE